MGTYYGTAGNDLMDPMSSAGDYMYGLAGNDTIYGWYGNDSLNGGDNNDTLYGEAHNDTLDGWTGNDNLYGGANNDKLLGWTGNDNLYGGANNDTLYGEADSDILAGGFGQDVLYGGLGADKFHFNYVSEGKDVIKDFQWTQGDKIQIYKSGFGATSTGQFQYSSSTGALSFDKSPFDFAGPVQFATIENKPSGFLPSLDISLVDFAIA